MTDNWASLIASISTCLLLLHSCSAQGVEHYCDRNQTTTVSISGESEGSIRTLYAGESTYHNNQHCRWSLDAGPGMRVEITVVSSNLQWAPESAICPGYDHVVIKDGQRGGQDSVVLQWCGHVQPLGAISSGRHVQVEFMSDNNNPYSYTGVHLRFKTFSDKDCAPSWQSEPSGFCFKMMSKATDWSDAQRECNAENANLASVTSQSQHDFLLQAFPGSVMWIGLSDIEELGSYRWIDESGLTLNKLAAGHGADKYSRCVALHPQEEEWRSHSCEEFHAKPLCKSNRGRTTDLFAIPQEKKVESGVNTAMVVGIAVATAVLLVLIAISVCLYIRRKRSPSSSAYHAPKRTDGDSPHDTQATDVPRREAEATRSQSNRAGNGRMIEEREEDQRDSADRGQPYRAAHGSRIEETGEPQGNSDARWQSNRAGSGSRKGGGSGRGRTLSPLPPTAPPAHYSDAANAHHPPSSQMIAPPTYEESLTHAVLPSPNLTTYL